jgi:hypothetical protein
MFNLPLQQVRMNILTFILLVRAAAACCLAIGILGMLWSFDFYFSGEYLASTVVMATPLVCLLVGIITFEKLFHSKLYFLAYQSLFAIGIVCVVLSMTSDLNLTGGADYAAFKAHFFLLGLLLIFAIRAIFVHRTPPMSA